MGSDPAAFSLTLDPAALAPLVRGVVAEALQQLRQAEAALDGKLAYREGEAARLLSLAPHQLRDERLRGRVAASTGPGGLILYTREQLLGYLASRRWEEGQSGRGGRVSDRSGKGGQR